MVSFIRTLEILFTKLNIMFTEADLDERIQKLQEAYGPIIKGVLGMFLTTSTKELIIPLLNMLLSNQISLGFNGGPGSTSASFLKTKVIGQPTISIADGVNVPLSLEFVKV